MSRFQVEGLDFGRLALSAASALALIALASGCADKDIDQFRESQVNQQVFKMSPIDGEYQGPAVSLRDGSVIGNMTLDIEVDTEVQASSDNLKTELAASVHGAASLTGGATSDGPTSAAVLFTNAYYDPTTGHFKAQVVVTNVDTTTTTLEIDGTISGNTLTGTMSAEGYDDSGAKITLTKNGPAISTQGLRAQADMSPGSVKNFVAHTSFADRPTPMDVNMSISIPNATADQRMVDAVDPVIVAKVVLCGDPDPTTGTCGFDVSFDTASYDSRTQTLTGRGTGQIGGALGSSAVSTQLTCSRASSEAWNCTFVGDGQPVQLNFTAALPSAPPAAGSSS